MYIKKRIEKEYIQQQLVKNIGRSSKQAIIDTVSYYLARGEADKAASIMHNSRSVETIWKNKLWEEYTSNKHSIQAVSLVKQITDQIDKYHIFKMNSRDINCLLSFVSKCSKLMAQLMPEMDIDSPEKICCSRNMPILMPCTVDVKVSKL